MFGNPETTTGGNALKFYSSVRIDIRRIGQIKDGEQVLGNLTRVKVVKNKVAPPFRRCEFDIMFGQGISKTGEILDFAIDFDIVKKSGSWISYADAKIAQGRDKALAVLNDNPELLEEIEAKVRKTLEENGGQVPTDDKKSVKKGKSDDDSDIIEEESAE